MNETLKPTALTITLGTIAMAQKRRAAYEKAAKAAGTRSLGEWVKRVLDKAADFEDKA